MAVKETGKAGNCQPDCQWNWCAHYGGYDADMPYIRLWFVA